MTQVIMTNVASLNSQRQLNKSQAMLNTSLERLSSGLRINTAKDDAAGLAISQRMTSQINGMNQAVRNANDGVSMSQTAEGALATAGDLLTRIRELAVQSSNASKTSSDRQAIQSEVGQLTSELDRISTSTQFNGQNLLDGTAGTLSFQVGANANQTITTSSANFRTTAYGDNRIATSSVQASAASNASASTIDVSGYLGSGTYTTSATDTAKSIAAGINTLTAKTGVTASAVTNVSVALASESYSFSIQSDNKAADAVTVSFSVTGTAASADDYAAGISAINSVSSKTGVTAQFDSTNKSIKLTNASGNDIILTNKKATDNTKFEVATYDNTSTTADTLIATPNTTAVSSGGVSTINGRVTYDSTGSFAVTDTASGFASGAASSTLKSVSTLDVTTYDNSQLAIAIVDSALAAVNNQRAQYGAMQNRFTSVVANLQSSSENLSASRSRIQDADFAAETASMSKANILQQAGTAMLAQANSAPQNVLSLLK